MALRIIRRFLSPLLLILMFPCLFARSQTPEDKISKQDLSWLKDVLTTTRDDIRKNYYDAHYHGLDIDSRFQLALEKLQSASTRNYAVAGIAGAVSALNDSHTVFLPPPRPYVHENGWRMQAEGDSDCFITAVHPDSDAAKKGLKVGDQLLSVAGYTAVSRGCLENQVRLWQPSAPTRLAVDPALPQWCYETIGCYGGPTS
jgi:C-terminal processing protease CtpA/Prc